MTNTVHEAIEAAERLLPGVAAPDGELDPRWQAIIEVEGFIETDPEEICAKFGQAEEPGNSERFDGLQNDCGWGKRE